MTPTARTLAELRKRGFLAHVVEKWIPQTRRRSDLFGFIDVLGVHDDGTVVAVQSTSGSNVASRVNKIADHENIARVRKAGWLILVHGWRKNAKGRWTLTERDLS